MIKCHLIEQRERESERGRERRERGMWERERRDRGMWEREKERDEKRGNV